MGVTGFSRSDGASPAHRQGHLAAGDAAQFWPLLKPSQKLPSRQEPSLMTLPVVIARHLLSVVPGNQNRSSWAAWGSEDHVKPGGSCWREWAGSWVLVAVPSLRLWQRGRGQWGGPTLLEAVTVPRTEALVRRFCAFSNGARSAMRERMWEVGTTVAGCPLASTSLTALFLFPLAPSLAGPGTLFWELALLPMGRHSAERN